MRPQGLRPIRFPSKTKEWFGKGILMWWEKVIQPSKKRDRQESKRDIEKYDD